ncbi:hypothetical protein KAR91_69820 [Candidatus Pacearchaeota archaeon]|nr:hypothetical protein [Candidatus Pacearchaeota archaeon]
MSDISEMYQERKEAKQKLHLYWNRQNTIILDKSGIDYKKASQECYLFRQGQHKADFYPSTGRWKCKGRIYRGGAQKFIDFWRNLTRKKKPPS